MQSRRIKSLSPARRLMKADCLLSKGSKLCNSGLAARYDYDPWGRRTKTDGGGVEGDFGFTGHYFHTASGLHLTLYRAYSADLARWNSQDPLAFRDGINLYRYVRNNPLSHIDLLGLTCEELDLCYRACVDFWWLPRYACRRECRKMNDCDRVMEACKHFVTETECQQCCDEVCEADLHIHDVRCRETCYYKACRNCPPTK